MIDTLPDAFGIEHRKARKEHRCCECRGLIQKGEHYFYSQGVWDHKGQSFKTCEECEALREKVNQYYDEYEDRPAFNQLYEAVFDIENIDICRTYINTKIKRGAAVPQWMSDRLTKWEKNAKQKN